MNMYLCKCHENISIQVSRKCINANLTEIYTCKSHGNGQYIHISSKWIHANLICIHANLMKMDTCKAHEYVYMQISRTCIHANLMEMNTCKSHEYVYMQIS